MRFTIVTPLMNGMPWLPECVHSVDDQRADVDVEHIVLDAGSTDGSREWLRANAPHATLVFEPDQGQTDALQKGFARATGDVLGWLNADDAFEPHALRRVAAAFADHPGAAAVVGSMLFVDERSAVRGVASPPADCSLQGVLHFRHTLPQPATLFRRTAYEKCGGFDLGLDLAMDVDLWLKLAHVGEVVPLAKDVLARFRLHPDAKSVRRGAAAAREDFAIRRRNGMRLLSPAGVDLIRYGYAQAAIAPLWRRFGKPAWQRLLSAPGDKVPRG